MPEFDRATLRWVGERMDNLAFSADAKTSYMDLYKQVRKEVGNAYGEEIPVVRSELEEAAYKAAYRAFQQGDLRDAITTYLAVSTYLAALSEPPLDEWLKSEEALNAVVAAMPHIEQEAQGEGGTLNVANDVLDSLIEALAEHRKESGDG